MASRREKPRQDAQARVRAAAAEIYRVVRAVTLDEIAMLDEVQVRVNGLDEARVEQYVEFLLAGGAFKDPIDLFEDGWRLILSAGWHRTEAYRRALKRFVPSKDVPALASLKAEIHPGGLEAAIEWAEEDNLAHGLELSPRDKRNILERRFRRGHEWASLSNRALAAKLGVHHDTIAAWRREIAQSSTGGNPPVERMSADGKLRDVSNIQAANQRRAEEQREVREREAAIADLRVRILERLAGGPLRSIELAAALGEPPYPLYRQAREGLKADGLIVEEVAQGMRVTYRLAGRAPAPEPPPAPIQNGSEWLDTPASKGAPPQMAAAANGAPAHSDDHNPALAEAHLASMELSQAVVTVLQAGEALMQRRGIRALYAATPERLERHVRELDELKLMIRNLDAYCQMQTSRLHLMARSGRPYDEEDGEA